MAGKEAIVTVQDAISDYQEKRSHKFPNGSIDMEQTSTRPINTRPPIERQLSDGDSEEEGLTQLGLKWQRIRRNVLLRYIIYIVPVAIVLAIPIVLFSTVYKGKKIISKFTVSAQTPIYTSNITSIEPAAANGSTTYNNTASTVYRQTSTTDNSDGIHYLGLFIWIEVVWVLLWVAKLMAQAVPIVFQTIGGAIHTGIRKYWLVLKAVEIPLSLFFWAILMISSWSVIYVFDKPFHTKHAGNIKWLHTLHMVLKATVGVTALYLVERMLIQMISVSYHGKQFYDNIRELKALSRALETMYDVSRIRFCDHHPLFIEDDLDIHDTQGYRKDQFGRRRTKDQSTASSCPLLAARLTS